MGLFSIRFQPFAVLPILVIVTAFILSFLCLFAGHKPGMMEEYAVFTLNVSRIGQDVIQDIDDKIMGLNISKILNSNEKRSEPILLANIATITAAPTATITMVPRQLDSLIGDLTEGVHSLKTEAGGKFTSAKSAVESKATALASAAQSQLDAVESAAVSKIESAFLAVQTTVVEAINNTYVDFIEKLELSDFYSIHMMTTCTGEYVMPNGTNVTLGISPSPPNGTERRVDVCESHSAIDPLVLVRILYGIAIFFTGCALALGLWGMVCFSRKAAIINVLGSLPALGLLALASAAAHGLAVGASKLINFVGDGVGIEASAGRKFIALTWATTILVLVYTALWAVLFFVGEKLPTRRNKNEDAGLPEHEMKIQHPHYEGQYQN